MITMAKVRTGAERRRSCGSWILTSARSRCLDTSDVLPY